ncbi:hypothetical protein U9M48_003133 [Paspalum notatum var. saurae]|uniref:Uncharacterized protein n=1 Tax=Paspalum notatum var. saurae TaxID=547442 RepID=A0AAQ3SKE0_PASNO
MTDDAPTAAVLEAERQAAAATAAAARRALQDEVARHEQALADARRRLVATPPPEDEDEDAGSVTSNNSAAGNAISSLHTQAMGILNIRALIPMVLDLNAPFFSKWRRLLLLALGKYALADHVLSDASFSADPHWVRMDLYVLSWVYGTITTDLFEVIITASPSDRGTWVALEQQFLRNRETRVILVDTEFSTLS